MLQLLFDARFLLDLLAGGRPWGTEGTAAAVAARRREAAQLEAGLAARLDPIDWATYEPYLYANKDRAAARCQVGDDGWAGGRSGGPGLWLQGPL